MHTNKSKGANYMGIFLFCLFVVLVSAPILLRDQRDFERTYQQDRQRKNQ